jgi:glycosyltransferase involved in cell wall biosynthesis
MRTLVLITSHFPFGIGESFIEPEIPILAEKFDKVLIISQDTSGKQTRNICDNIKVFRYNPSTSVTGFLTPPCLILRNYGIIIKAYKEEVDFRRIIHQRLTLKQSGYLFKKIIKAVQLKDFIKRLLSEEEIKGPLVFYSYWLNTGAHAIGFLNCRESIRIARAHGSDLYEEKSKSLFLPLLRFSAMKLNAIFFISEHGRKYFAEKTGQDDSRLILSRLGTIIPEHFKPLTVNPDRFVIVSCSNLIPLKRIDLLINSLGLLQTKKEVMWLHFGDGPLRSDLENLAREKLGKGKRTGFRFMGFYPNQELLKFYSDNDINLFINVSSTEGVPVSIMEAQSFGIPVIATDTGGVRELVVEGTGTLIPINFEPADLAKFIQYYAELSDVEMRQIKLKAFNNWSTNFNAVLNYKDFVKKVNSILAPEKNCSDLFL